MRWIREFETEDGQISVWLIEDARIRDHRIFKEKGEEYENWKVLVGQTED